MFHKRKRMRWFGAFLSMLMLFSVCGTSVHAEGISVTFTEDTITPETTSVTVNLSQVPSLGILKIIELDAEDSYSSDQLNNYTSLYFGAFYTTAFQEGANVLTLTAAPTEGKKLLAVVRDSSGTVTDYVSDPVTVTSASAPTDKTPEQILANSKVQLMQNGAVRTEAFREDAASVDVAVQLDDTVASCNLTIFAYAKNTSFDPDASQNIRLWSGMVTNGYTGTCTFNNNRLPLKVGYSIIACLNVPVGNDPSGDTFYRSSASQAIEVVDENGNGFEDYSPYPNASIDETTLEAGATSLHISLVGDTRLFQAAKEGKTNIICAVAQYPADEDFDFENTSQIALVSNLSATEAFSGKEITFASPLLEGYRVRAVVYWSQNEEIFLPKGNDYEAMFHQADDSIPVSSSSPPQIPAAAISGDILTDTESISVSISGTIPEGSTLLVKSYDSTVTEFAMSAGTWVGSAFDVTAGTHSVSPLTGSLAEGRKVVAFVQNSGTIVAQSEPVTVQKAQPFTITGPNPFTTETTTAAFQVTAKDSSITNINITALCRVNASGVPDTANPVARLFGQAPGTLSFSISKGTLSAGDRVCLVLTYNNGNSVYTSESFTVTAPLAADSLAILETSFTTESTSATVLVSGCEEFVGGRLILTAGPASNTSDADSRTQLGSVSFTGEGRYTVSINSALLKAGETILPHLYRYDSLQDTVSYKYGDPVSITAPGGQLTEANVEIATSTITADRTDLWAIVSFDASLTGTLKLYTYAGETFDTASASEIYSAAVSSSKNSQRITFGSDKLTAGEKLVAMLILSNNTQLTTPAKVIQAAPAKTPSAAAILDSHITAGDTYLKASLTFDSSASNASFALYQFTGDTLDTGTADRISYGTLYRSETNRSVYLGSGRLTVGSKLQLVLTVDGTETKSNIVTVEPSPDWGTPYAAFDVTAVKADADDISVTIDYSDEYLSLGDAFYCDVTIYQFSAAYTDDEFEEQELWENTTLVSRVGQVNSNHEEQTKGQITIPVKEGVTLNPGDRLIIKLRLPHTEWDGEEVDYLSVSVPVIGADDEIPDYKVVLYGLDEDLSRGDRVRRILDGLGIPAQTLSYSQLNESVGHLAGLEGYSAASEPYTGQSYSTEFMLMCNLPESLLDRFLDAMTEDGLRIDHKAVVTEYNRGYLFYELIGDIEEEHDVFQALITLNTLVKDAEKLTDANYGTSPDWETFKEALTAANRVLSAYEPTLEQLQNAYDTLKEQYLSVTGMTELTGTLSISIEADSSGTYTMTANLQEGRVSADYQFTWSNGRTGKSISGIAAEKLIGTKVTATGSNMYGSLTAQLQVPDAPQATVSAESNALQISWKAQSAKDNQPSPTGYVLTLFQGGTLQKTITLGGTDCSAVLDGLTADTTYDVKLYAVSPVGRSDRITLTAATTAASDDNAANGNPSGPANPGTSDTPSTPGGSTESQTPTTPGTSDNSSGSSGTSSSGSSGNSGFSGSSGTSGNSGSSSASAASAAAHAPKTGDDSLLLFAALLLTLSGAGIGTLVGYRRRHGN